MPVLRLDLRFKRLDPRAILPSYQTAGAAGMDLCSVEDVTVQPHAWVVVHTGLAVAIPEHYEGQVRSRSGLAARHGVVVLNAPGTIDSDYRGEILVALVNHNYMGYWVKAGERIAQLVICEVTHVAVREASDLEETVRGVGGFGSTGRC